MEISCDSRPHTEVGNSTLSVSQVVLHNHPLHFFKKRTSLLDEQSNGVCAGGLVDRYAPVAFHLPFTFQYTVKQNINACINSQHLFSLFRHAVISYVKKIPLEICIMDLSPSLIYSFLFNYHLKLVY